MWHSLETPTGMAAQPAGPAAAAEMAGAIGLVIPLAVYKRLGLPNLETAFEEGSCNGHYR
jgi:hypothetical protein